MGKIADVEKISAYVLQGINSGEVVVLPKDIIELHKEKYKGEIFLLKWRFMMIGKFKVARCEFYARTDN